MYLCDRVVPRGCRLERVKREMGYTTFNRCLWHQVLHVLFKFLILVLCGTSTWDIRLSLAFNIYFFQRKKYIKLKSISIDKSRSLCPLAIKCQKLAYKHRGNKKQKEEKSSIFRTLTKNSREPTFFFKISAQKFASLWAWESLIPANIVIINLQSVIKEE